MRTTRTQIIQQKDMEKRIDSQNERELLKIILSNKLSDEKIYLYKKKDLNAMKKKYSENKKK